MTNQHPVSISERVPTDSALPCLVRSRSPSTPSTMSQTKFEKAVSIVQGLPKDGPIQPTQDEQLYFYSYYKQATVGDVNIPRPGLMDFTGKAKWDAWKKVEGTSKEDAYSKYVEKLLEVLKKADTEEAKQHIVEIEAA